MNSLDERHDALDRFQRRCLMVGAAGAALLVLGWGQGPGQFFRSYLAGYLFWIGLPLGSLALLMLHHLVSGAWGFMIRRLLEASARTLPVMALLFAPLLLGLEELYSWARPEAVAADPILQEKSWYLNVPFFLARLGFYFAVWLAAAYGFYRWSGEQDRSGAPGLQRRMQLLSGPGLLLYGLTVTFAAIDWMMSLEPHWFSTIYGLLAITGQALLSLAFAIVGVTLLARREPLASALKPDHLHDLGNLLLALVMIWAYMGFSQYLIIWSANLAEEVPWYLHRTRGGWQWVAIFLVVFHFFVPFLLLLSRATKRHLRMLQGLALALLGLRWLDLLWLVKPAFSGLGPALHWLDAASMVALGGIWLGFFAGYLKARPLLPRHDPAWEGDKAHG